MTIWHENQNESHDKNKEQGDEHSVLGSFKMKQDLKDNTCLSNMARAIFLINHFLRYS